MLKAKIKRCQRKEMKEEKIKEILGSGGIRTHASEETGALNQRLRPLGHATLLDTWRKEFWQRSRQYALTKSPFRAH